MTLLSLMNQQQRSADPWMTDLFDSLFREKTPETAERRWTPAVNISESPAAFEIELATPGINKKDLTIDLEKDLLVLSYEHAKGEEERQYSRKGFEVRSFNRSFHLPKTVDKEKIEASYTDGVLRILLNKKEEAVSEPRQIAVK
jgi:HSP20 family protein